MEISKMNNTKSNNTNSNNKNNNIIIRKETEEDYYATELCTLRAFWNIHGPGCNEHLMIHKLRDSKDYLPEISRVAELDGQIVGVIMYHKARIVDGDKETEIISFGPLAVEPTCFNMGIGGKLLKETLALAKESGYLGATDELGPEAFRGGGVQRIASRFGEVLHEARDLGAVAAIELRRDPSRTALVHLRRASVPLVDLQP